MSVITLNPGQKVGLSAHLLFPDDGYGHPKVHAPIQTHRFVSSNGENFNWSSSNPSAATVAVNTLWVNGSPTAQITALAVGSTTISCTSGALTSNVTVNVVPDPDPSSLVITVGIVGSGWGS